MLEICIEASKKLGNVISLEITYLQIPTVI